MDDQDGWEGAIEVTTAVDEIGKERLREGMVEEGTMEGGMPQESTTKKRATNRVEHNQTKDHKKRLASL
jgi:hypothetical protein